MLEYRGMSKRSKEAPYLRLRLKLVILNIDELFTKFGYVDLWKLVDQLLDVVNYLTQDETVIELFRIWLFDLPIICYSYF